MGGFYIPSYLDASDGNANFKLFADSFTRRGPNRFKPISGDYTLVPDDSDVVLRCDSTTEITVPFEQLGQRRFPVGAEVAVLNYSEKRVVIVPAEGVTVSGPERLSIDRWRWGVLVKQNANLWLLSLGNMGGGDAKGVPLPPKITSAFGVSAGAVLVWSPPVDDGGSPITQYIVEQSTDEQTWDAAGVTKADVLTLTVNDLTVGTKYFFRVKAVNANGVSDPSGVADATPTQDFNEATGGTITTYKADGRYFRVHTFTASTQEFVVTKAVSPFSVLVVGGGGGGGRCTANQCGYGGNGGQVVQQQITLTSGAHPLVIGNGGSGGTQEYAPAPSGQPSTFASITANGGGGGNTPCPNYKDKKPAPASGGTAVSITGSEVQYGQNGGEGGDQQVGGTGGIGGGGGGAAGGTGGDGSPQSGKPGVVIVSYEIAPFNDAEGGAVSTYTKDGKKYKVHSFTDNSTLIVKSAERPFRILAVGAGAGWSGFGPSCAGGSGCERGRTIGGGGNYYLNNSDALAKDSFPVSVGVGSGPGADGCCDAGGAGCCPGGGGKAAAQGGPSSIAGKVGAGGTGTVQQGTPVNHYVTSDILNGTDQQFGSNTFTAQGARGLVIVSYEIDPAVTEYDHCEIPAGVPCPDETFKSDGPVSEDDARLRPVDVEIVDAEAIVKGAKRAGRK